MGELRRQAYAHWHRRLGMGKYGMEGLRKDLYHELLWDQFVVVWQTIGRLVRRGRHARVFFVDAAFCPSEKGRSMLRGWVEILDEYIGPQSNKMAIERQLTATSYDPAYQAFRTLINQNGG
jgi:hypothetical protein